ncbi:hypothetical protein H5410_024788 [Solanum commersonii]|uniref:Uncharacterized protein n=1 Tax=Solanum commersonii TaxID=4109 RepID=A0A9J5ZN00_SOLCO|nr:hypothetical protein H5410_024788 [Solanum commersonii]
MESTPSISKNYGRSLKKSINRTFSSTLCENLAPINYQNGILQTPPMLYQSFPPFLVHQKQPPLLPLPISKSNVHQHYNNYVNTLSQNRAFSLPPTNRKFNKSKKTSPKPKSSKVVPLAGTDKIETIQKKSAIVSSTNPLGPDPKDLPKDVAMVFPMSSSTGGKEYSIVALSSNYVQKPIKYDANRNQLSILHMTTSEKVQSIRGALSSGFAWNPIKNDANSSMVFNTTISPPPSSLPLPTFSLRPKQLSCNAEVATGVDTGATDNLRRLLRLR